jgi:hypothetical protein
VALSAFDDKTVEPGIEAVAAVLGPAAEYWETVVAEIGRRFEPLALDWVFSGKKWGWGLRLKQKKRAVVYLTPVEGFFLAGFALGRKAVEVAERSELPRSILDAIANAPKYAEGRGVRLVIRSQEDADSIVLLATIKMAN